MATKKIIWTETSLSELEKILKFYIQRNQNSDYSIWLLAELEKRISIISNHTKIGRKTDILNLRILPFKNYEIFYKELDDKVIIESIWDFRQNPLKRIDNK